MECADGRPGEPAGKKEMPHELESSQGIEVTDGSKR